MGLRCKPCLDKGIKAAKEAHPDSEVTKEKYDSKADPKNKNKGRVCGDCAKNPAEFRIIIK